MDEDRVGTLADLAYVIRAFQNARRRLAPGLSRTPSNWRRRDQFARVPDAGGVSMLKQLGTSRENSKKREAAVVPLRAAS